jgi:hypothetical protein
MNPTSQRMTRTIVIVQSIDADSGKVIPVGKGTGSYIRGPGKVARPADFK